MKKLLLLLLPILFLTLSCSSDDDDDNTEDNLPNNIVFRAKINGEEITATTITGNNLTHQNQAAILVFYAENDQYKFTVTLADYNNNSNCLSTGDYKNNIDGKEIILWISYKHNGSTQMVHQPVRDANNFEDSAEFITVSSCGNNKISGTFSCTYEKMGEINGLVTPDDIILTEGVFENIPFNVVN